MNELTHNDNDTLYAAFRAFIMSNNDLPAEHIAQLMNDVAHRAFIDAHNDGDVATVADCNM
jgi:hypothetical protein